MNPDRAGPDDQNQVLDAAVNAVNNSILNRTNKNPTLSGVFYKLISLFIYLVYLIKYRGAQERKQVQDHLHRQ